MSEHLALAVDVLGVVLGMSGVIAAVYLQLVNPRHPNPGRVMLLFLVGAAVTVSFGRVFLPFPLITKVAAVLLAGVVEVLIVYQAWRAGEVVGPVRALADRGWLPGS